MTQLTNVTTSIQRQGLKANFPYEGIVVDNDDPLKLYRIRVRIPGIHEGIEDDELPWASSRFAHTGGALKVGAKKQLNRSGSCFIPQKKSKVRVEFPDITNIYLCFYDGYVADEKTQLPEFVEKNYPYRMGHKFPNGTYIVLDTKTHELFIAHNGDFNMTVLGDLNQQVVGNYQMRVGPKDIVVPSYLKDAPEMVLKDMKAKPSKNIDFGGLLSKENSSHFEVEGDYTVHVKGNRKTIIDGKDELEVKGDKSEQIKGSKNQKIDGGKKSTVKGNSQEQVKGNKRIRTGGKTFID